MIKKLELGKAWERGYFLPPFLHTGSDQKLEPGKAWERGYFLPPFLHTGSDQKLEPGKARIICYPPCPLLSIASQKSSTYFNILDVLPCCRGTAGGGFISGSITSTAGSCPNTWWISAGELNLMIAPGLPSVSKLKSHIFISYTHGENLWSSYFHTHGYRVGGGGSLAKPDPSIARGSGR